MSTSADFVMPENRTRGLTIRSYTFTPTGEITDDTGTVRHDPDDVDAHAYHPSATWPACSCGNFGHAGR